MFNTLLGEMSYFAHFLKFFCIRKSLICIEADRQKANVGP